MHHDQHGYNHDYALDEQWSGKRLHKPWPYVVHSKRKGRVGGKIKVTFIGCRVKSRNRYPTSSSLSLT